MLQNSTGDSFFGTPCGPLGAQVSQQSISLRQAEGGELLGLRVIGAYRERSGFRFYGALQALNS